MPFADVVWALADLDERAEHVRLCRDYYEGRHRKVIPESKTLNRTIRELIERLRDNLCDDVVDEPVSRTSITNWTVGGTQAQAPTDDGEIPPTSRASMAAVAAWAANRGDARAKDVHRDHWAIGDGFVIVQRDSQQRPRFYPQRPEIMAIRYSEDEPDQPEVAAKCWRAGRRWRITLYYPGKDGGRPFVERYATKGLGADGARPQARAFEPVTDSMGMGKPVETLEGSWFPVHHAPAGEVGRYGRSVLDPVIPLQDMLNKSLADMVVAMEDTALPMRYATGVQAEYNPVTGDERPLLPTGRERMIRTGSDKAQFGQFPQIAFDGFLGVQNTTRCEIARKGWLPLHSVNLDPTGAAPSGIALLVSEGRLVKRVKSSEDDTLEPFWREVMAHLLELGGMKVDPQQIDIEWAPAETRDEQALVETLTAKVDGLGLPKRQALIEDGYDADDVDEWLEDAAAQADAIAGGRVSRVPVPPNGGPHLLPAPPATPAGAPASGVSA